MNSNLSEKQAAVAMAQGRVSSQATNSIVAVSGSTSTLLVAANDEREGLIIQNGNSVDLFLKFGSPIANTSDVGIFLPAGAFYNMDVGYVFTGAIYGLCESSVSVRVVEFSK